VLHEARSRTTETARPTARPRTIAPTPGHAEQILAIQRRAGNRAARATLARRVEMRDVGRGEASGFARVQELVDRMTALSPSLIFSLDGRELRYEQVAGLDPNEFDRQMMALIDQDPVLPLRLTNRHGLLGDRASGFHDPVDGDAFASGYVDIDDLLAGDDLGFQMLLVHFLTERAATRNYARRIGTNFSDAEFDRGHRLGIDAEARILQDFFGDPSIRILRDSPSVTIRRVFRNDRGDRIRRRIRIGRGAERGIHASFVDVVTRDGVVHTAEEYRAILQGERDAAALRQQIERERLGGADEHRAGGRGVPAP
jgi:hypothetical protein